MGGVPRHRFERWDSRISSLHGKRFAHARSSDGRTDAGPRLHLRYCTDPRCSRRRCPARVACDAAMATQGQRRCANRRADGGLYRRIQARQRGLARWEHATTHHDYFDAFARQFPNVVLERGPRYVQSAQHIFTAGGTTSGIDLALHIVSRYYGEDAAKLTARYMEYHPVSQ